MSTQIKTLGDALPEEIERCQELLTQYKELGEVGMFGYAVINQTIKRSHKAMMDGDVVAMLQAYEALKGCK